MKKTILLLSFAFCLFTFVQAQEFADFEITATNQGTGSFINAALSDFHWMAQGSLESEVQIRDEETFLDGNAFENEFGQADNAENLRIQNVMNGAGTAGQPITSISTMIIEFDEIAAADVWGFCLLDIDVENVLISATDADDMIVPNSVIDSWLVQLFDADLMDGTVDIPKWDAANAAILGADTPEGYTVYNNIVIGGMSSSEAPGAFFKPNIPIKSLSITFENLQDDYAVSYHLYIASNEASAISEFSKINFDIYPNPCRDKFGVHSSEFGVDGRMIEVYDISGRSMIKRSIPTGRETLEIDVSSLPAGVYFIKLQTEEAVGVRKIIKK